MHRQSGNLLVRAASRMLAGWRARLASGARGSARRPRTALDRFGFYRAMCALGWDGGTLVVASSFLQRLRGLGAYRPERPGARAEPVLGFPRCRSVHTWFMHRPIDVAFIDAQGGLVAFYHAVPPGRVRSCPHAASVLERFSGTDLGDRRGPEGRDPARRDQGRTGPRREAPARPAAR